MGIKELRKKTETYLTKFYPEVYVPKIVSTTQDIYEYRTILKGIVFNERILCYLATIIIVDIEHNKRFRKHDCIKVLQSIVKAKGNNQVISEEVISNLFKIYKELIFIDNEEIQWHLSSIFKDSILPNEDIEWLVCNYRESNHILNRLLRYPKKNSLVTAWAKKVYLYKEIPERLSEIIGLLIDKDIPSYVKERGEEIIWGIYYSTSNDTLKRKLLCKYFSIDNIDAVLEVSSRLNYPSVIKYVYKELK